MHYTAPAKFSLSHEHVTLMLYKLRNANDRYTRIAAQIRARTTSRYQCRSYRIRAAWLGLRVDVNAALALAGSQISKNPLPILDTTTPTPAESKVFLCIPPSHVRTTQLPFITATAPTPVFATDVSRVEKIYSPIPPIRIPPRGPHVQLDGIDWGVPGAPLMKPRELPDIMPNNSYVNFSPMSMDFDSYGLSAPEDPFAVALRIKLPSKRKIKDIDVDDTLSQKHHLRKRWAQTSSTQKVTSRAVHKAYVYF